MLGVSEEKGRRCMLLARENVWQSSPATTCKHHQPTSGIHACAHFSDLTGLTAGCRRPIGAADPQLRNIHERQPTAPSVPARNQVFGYEEDDSGRLMLQPPPEEGHTGEGGDRPGPMSYSPDKSCVLRAAGGTAWGKSKAQRGAALGGMQVGGFACPECVQWRSAGHATCTSNTIQPMAMYV